jgi:hypothetical protein
MDSHVDFWLLAGAAAPVLLLAQILNTASSTVSRPRGKSVGDRGLLKFVSLLGFGTSCYVLFDSLAVLGNLLSDDSRVRRWITVVMIFVSAVCLLASSSGILALQQPNDEERRDRKD